MKNYYLLFLLLFSFGLGFAQTQDSLSLEEQNRREKNIQAGNPFKKFGYKPKISTLSKGRYLEFHDLDSIVQIGSFTFHVKKRVITGYIVKETKYSEATLRPEVVSRWFSPDPLSDEFPSWSPYVFTNDNPIFFTDPTGLAPETIYENSITGETVEVEDGVDKTIVVDEEGFEEAKKYSEKGKVNKENYTPEEFSEYENFYNNQLYGETSEDRISNIFDYFKDGLVEQLLDSGLKNPYQDVAVLEDYGLLSGGGKNAARGTGKIIKAANGLEINGFVKHGLNRIIQRGISPGSIVDALKNPLKVGKVIVDKLGRQSQRFIGKAGEIVVNPKTGKIISGNPTSSKKAARLLKRK